MLEKCTQLTSVNFGWCRQVTGESSGGRFLSELRTSPLFLWTIPFFGVTDSALPTLYSTSLPHAGKFEDFKALSALLELNINYCKKIDCKNALEVLPTMPWAAQIQKLALYGTDAEGTMGTFFF